MEVSLSMANQSNPEEWTKKEQVLLLTAVWILVSFFAYIAPFGSRHNSFLLPDQEVAYQHCIRGVPEDNALFWRRQCLAESGQKLAAPFFSLFKPITYTLHDPRLEQVYLLRSETKEDAQVYRRLTAEVSQTFPVGKRVRFLAAVHTIQLDGVCVFFDTTGELASVAENCDIHPDFHWTRGQAGFDGRAATRNKATEIVAEIGFEDIVITHYDWWASLFYASE